MGRELGGGLPRWFVRGHPEGLHASGGGGSSFGSCYNHRNGFALGSETRGVFGGGDDFSTYGINTIEYVTISSIGNAQDFGDLTARTERIGGGQISDSHGGLGGF